MWIEDVVGGKNIILYTTNIDLTNKLGWMVWLLFIMYICYMVHTPIVHH